MGHRDRWASKAFGVVFLIHFEDAGCRCNIFPTLRQVDFMQAKQKFVQIVRSTRIIPTLMGYLSRQTSVTWPSENLDLACLHRFQIIGGSVRVNLTGLIIVYSTAEFLKRTHLRFASVNTSAKMDLKFCPSLQYLTILCYNNSTSA